MIGFNLVLLFLSHVFYNNINVFGNEIAESCEAADSFQCQDNVCIWRNLTCNNNADCKNGEDEAVSLCGCLPNEFACAQNDTCIALIRRCDRFSDCPENEDEENCDTYMCPETHVKCQDHFCIQKELVCDFHKDCLDGSDEVGCSYRDCWVGEFRCNNAECIPPGYVCDGSVDCSDASDEDYCLKESCADGRKIHESYRCNGWADCETTHEDELLDCPSCNQTQHTCQNGRCIPLSRTCDGICDCLHSCDDENQCDAFYTKLNGLTVCTVGATIACSSVIKGQKIERCVAAKFLCNGVEDCPTGSDEYGCSSRGQNLSHIFQCDSPDDRFLDISAVCDEKADCLQAEDERHCFYNSTIYLNPFFCGNGQVINSSQQCDLLTDCWDKSDETDCTDFPCSERRHFVIRDGREMEIPMKSCRTGQCIRQDYWCDFIKDCADGSDEDSCPSANVECGENEFRCRTLNQCVPSYLRCYDDRNPRSGCADGSHLEGCQDVICSTGMFKCRNGACINESLLCNGVIDCPDVWTDEQNCTYICYGECLCRDRTLNCTGLRLEEFPKDLHDPFNKVYFAHNRLRNGLTSEMFDAMHGVLELDLSNNSIQHLVPGVFRSLSELRILSLRDNLLWEIRNGTFDGLSLLTRLRLGGNNLTRIEFRGFYGLSSLTTLSLSAQHLSNISRGAFVGLSNLNKLDLSKNKLEYLSDGIFIGLSQIKNLDLSGNPLVGIDPNAFRSVLTLNHLVFDEFRFCCSARRVRKCLPNPDEFSSCEDLMSNFVLRICVWLLGVIATFGNLLVIVWRIRYQHNNRVHSFLITNLAIGDLFMGIYLVVIAFVDLRYRGEYSVHDKEWRTSRLCGLVGFLSTFSSELSVFTLTVITLDRFLAIIFPFKFTRLEMNQTIWVMTGVWIVAIFISGLPLADIEYFKDFYGRSGVCLALHITPDKPNGWEYSVFVFLILNLISFSIIAFGYIIMYTAAKTTSLAVGRKVESRRAEAAMARRMTLIVATDAACWVPIILLGVLSLTGITVPKQVFAWVAVFVLPLNAAINPILYTISTAAFLNPTAHNLRHFNRFSTENRSRRTTSTNLGASSFRRSFLKFQRHLGSSFHCHDQQWSADNNHFELNAMCGGNGNQQQERTLRQCQPGMNLSHVEEDDSDYESESFNDRPDAKSAKGGEPVLIVRRQSLPRKKWRRSSDSESTEDQYCTNGDNRKRFGLSRSEGCEPISESEGSKWLGSRKKRKKKLRSELYD